MPPALCLQVLNAKYVGGKNGALPRFRLVVSDGHATIAAMLATQLNDTVERLGVTRGFILRLTEYIVNVVQSKT